MGDGTGCDNMTAVIVKFKPDFKLSKDQIDLCQENGETPQEASEECGKRLIPKSLKKHKKLVHQKVTPVECEVEDCGKKFNRKSHLADHMRMVHGFPKLKCTECTAEFMSESVLVKHRRGHSKDLE